VIEKDLGGLKNTYLLSLNQIWMLTMPAMIGLIVLREPFVRLLFEHGAFDAAATRLTVQALLYYACSLWALAAIRITVPVYYALDDTKLPTLAVTVALAVNCVCAMVLMPRLQAAGLALAVSLASLIQLAVLVQGLNRRLGLIDWPKLIGALIRSLFCSLFMGVCLIFASRLLLPAAALSPWQMVRGLGFCIALGVAIYGILSLWIQPSAVQSLKAAFLGSSRDR
jgi:putative peptidoglycan lipid II flippase